MELDEVLMFVRGELRESLSDYVACDPLLSNAGARRVAARDWALVLLVLQRESADDWVVDAV